MAVYWETEIALATMPLLSQRDGAGLYSAPRKLLVKHEKFDADDYLPMVDDTIVPFIVHARQVSSGVVDRENTQPFKNGCTVFCHNGTISRLDLPTSKVEVTDDSDDMLKKLCNIVNRSDSWLLAKSLASSTVEQAEPVLKEFTDRNNFILYNEVERKFLVMGTFHMIVDGPTKRVRAITYRTPELEGGIIVTGSLVISADGDILSATLFLTGNLLLKERNGRVEHTAARQTKSMPVIGVGKPREEQWNP